MIAGPPPSGYADAMGTLPADDIAHTIQAAITPVFLLAGIGSLLNVVAQRLGRTVDRARVLEARFPDLDGDAHDQAVWECLVIGALFVSELFGFGYARTMAVAFAVAMSLLIAGLAVFLLEVRLALLSVRVRVELLEHPDRSKRRWVERWR